MEFAPFDPLPEGVQGFDPGLVIRLQRIASPRELILPRVSSA
jgi:hypothetical protein